jgi:UDP-2,4-diacetamido-2,4,6-trideoxy-beta-L-altropyranose hydrolase
VSREQGCLILRADASSEIGMGHFMRCLALAQAWTETGERVIFAMSHTTPAADSCAKAIGATVTRLSSPRGSLPEAHETVVLAQGEQARCIVADGYDFAPGYQQALRTAGHRVLLLDDDARYQRYETDLVLNQNAFATDSLYEDRAAHTRLLLGPRYALLREQFRESPQPDRTIPATARRLLVTLGGADPANATQTVVEALRLLPANSVEAIVVVGGSNPHRAKLESALNGSPIKITLVHDAKNMPELMAWADVAISAAGSTSLELAYLGVPMLLTILADNQQAVATGMQSSGAARNLGWAHTLTGKSIVAALQDLIADQGERQRLSSAGQNLVDGEGAPRVVRALQAPAIHLRPAVSDDSRLLFEWANDSAVRAVSFNSAPIPWADHERWFRSKLSNPNAVLLIAQNENAQPIGVARFEIEQGVATISISISADCRGHGYGRELIDVASETVLRRPEVTSIRALVKPDNLASARAFLAADYVEVSKPDSYDPRLFVRTSSR